MSRNDRFQGEGHVLCSGVSAFCWCAMNPTSIFASSIAGSLLALQHSASRCCAPPSTHVRPRLTHWCLHSEPLFDAPLLCSLTSVQTDLHRHGRSPCRGSCKRCRPFREVGGTGSFARDGRGASAEWCQAWILQSLLAFPEFSWSVPTSLGCREAVKIAGYKVQNTASVHIICIAPSTRCFPPSC